MRGDLLPDLLVAVGCLILLAAAKWGTKRRIRRRPGPPPARKRPRLTFRQLVNLTQLHPTDLLVKDPPEPPK